MHATISVTIGEQQLLSIEAKDKEDIERIMDNIHKHPALSGEDLSKIDICVRRRFGHFPCIC